MEHSHAEHEHGHAEHSHDHSGDCCGHDHGDAKDEKHSHSHGAPTDVSDSAAAEDAVSKTEHSQQLKGSQSYYYWHGDAERRRQTGEQPVPVPLPKKLASQVENATKKRIKAIEKHQFLDDSDIVKVFIPLEGELLGATMAQIEAEFTEQSLLVTIEMADTIHRFWIDRLAHQIDPLRSKSAVTKSGKLVIKLRKRSHMDHWRMLRGVA
jgi:hypothetical protein